LPKQLWSSFRDKRERNSICVYLTRNVIYVLLPEDINYLRTQPSMEENKRGTCERRKKQTIVKEEVVLLVLAFLV
jgi:hypothetical protein